MYAECCKSASVRDKSRVCQGPIAKRSAYRVNGGGKAFKPQRLPPAFTSPCMLRAEAKLPDQQPDLQIHAGKEHERNNLPAQVSLSPPKSTHANPPSCKWHEWPQIHPSCKPGICYSKYILIACWRREQGDPAPPLAQPNECALIGTEGSAVPRRNKRAARLPMGRWVGFVGLARSTEKRTSQIILLRFLTGLGSCMLC